MLITSIYIREDLYLVVYIQALDGHFEINSDVGLQYSSHSNQYLSFSPLQCEVLALAFLFYKLSLIIKCVQPRIL